MRRLVSEGTPRNMKATDVLLQGMTLASIVILILVFFMPLRIADARVNINIAPESAPKYEEHHYDTDMGTVTPHAVVPGSDDEPSRNDASDVIGGALYMIFRLISYIPPLVSLTLLIGVIQEKSLDFIRRYLAEVRELIRGQSDSRSKKQAIGIFALLMTLFTLLLAAEAISTFSLDLLPLNIGFALSYLFGAVVTAVLLAKLCFEKRLCKARRPEEEGASPIVNRYHP